MAGRRTTKQGKDAKPPVKTKAEPLADGPTGMTAKRRAHVESLLDGLIQVARMSRGQGQDVESKAILNGDVEKSFGAICDEYGKDLLVVIRERLEHATARTDDSTIYEHADMLTSMMIHVRNPELSVADEINLTLGDMQAVVPVLMNQLEALVATHRAHNCNDQALEEVIWALNLSGDMDAQAQIAELAQEEGLVRDVRSLHCWREQNGDLVAKPGRALKTMSPERRERVEKVMRELLRMFDKFKREEEEDDGAIDRTFYFRGILDTVYEFQSDDILRVMRDALDDDSLMDRGEVLCGYVLQDMAMGGFNPDYEIVMPAMFRAIDRLIKRNSDIGEDERYDLSDLAAALFYTQHPAAREGLRQMLEEHPEREELLEIQASEL